MKDVRIVIEILYGLLEGIDTSFFRLVLLDCLLEHIGQLAEVL